MLWETVLSLTVLLNGVTAMHMFNVALRKNGGICLGASSTFNSNTGCGEAIDGKFDHNSMWMTKNEGEDSWIKLKFSNFYLIKVARIMQHSSSHEQSKDILMTFSDGSQQTFTLTENNETSWKKDLAIWDKFDLEPVLTNTVNITVLSVYTAYNNGFRELEFYVDLDSSWANWYEWSNCIGPCASGFRLRMRNCLNPFGGPTCQGNSQETRSCSQDDCSGDNLPPSAARQRSTTLPKSGKKATAAIVLSSLCLVVSLGIMFFLWSRTTKSYGNEDESILYNPETPDYRE